MLTPRQPAECNTNGNGGLELELEGPGENPSVSALTSTVTQTTISLTTHQAAEHNRDPDGVDAHEEADPGCLDNNRQQNNPIDNYEQELDVMLEAARLGDLRVAVDFIKALQSASLDDEYSNMDDEWLHQLRNPSRRNFDIERYPDLRLGLDTFLVSLKSSVDTYVTMREAIL